MNASNEQEVKVIIVLKMTIAEAKWLRRFGDPLPCNGCPHASGREEGAGFAEQRIALYDTLSDAIGRL